MANAFTKAQFMEPPTYGGQNPVPVGAVKAGSGIEILPDGTMNVTQGGGTINDIICTNGIQGGGSNPQVFIGLLPPNGTTIGGVYTVDGSGVSIDQNGLIRSTTTFTLSAGPGITLSNVTPQSTTITAAVAGATSITRGSIYVAPSTNPGVQVSPDGALSLTPPQNGGIGGVRAGTGCSIDPVTGVITATGTGGTITSVGAGTGLGGGGTQGSVTLFLRPAGFGGTPTTIGGVYAGNNVSINPTTGELTASVATPTTPGAIRPGTNCVVEPDGTLNVSSNLGVLTVNATAPLGVDQTDPSNPIVYISNATTTNVGATLLSNAVDSVSESQAATSLALKQTYDLAAGALQKSGGDMTGPIAFTGSQTFPGVLSLAGGTMTGDITFNAGQAFPGTVASSTFTTLGSLVVGTGAGTYNQLLPGTTGQVLSVDPTAPLGIKWSAAGTGTVSQVTALAPLGVTNQTTTPEITIAAATTTNSGAVQLSDAVNLTSSLLAATPTAVKTAYDLAAAALPISGGTMTGAITFGVGQTFPGTLLEGAIGGIGAITVGGTLANPSISVATATTSALGVVQPDGTTITIDGSGVISAVATGSFLPLSGGTMTGAITFAAGQTISGYVANTLFTTTGDIAYASAANTPTRLGIGAAGTILGVNGGLPSWRTTAQLGLLTSAAAATTYAPLNSPTLTGPVTVNAGGTAGANALTVSGGNLVLATAFTPTSSSDTGSVGEIAWDSSGYLYFCYLPNTWGRVQIDLTPF